jgi:hypothetical protein
MKKRGRQPLLVAVLGAMILGGAGAAVALDIGDDSRLGAPIPATTTPTPAAVSAELKDHFGIFRSAPTPDDALALGRPAGPAVAEHGVALALAQRLATPGTTRAWAVPAGTGLCLLVWEAGAAGPGGGCGTGPEVFSEGTTSSREAVDGTVETFGLVPDGVQTVRLRFEGGDDTSVQVTENAYYARTSRPAIALTFTGPDGPVNVDLGSPGD